MKLSSPCDLMHGKHLNAFQKSFSCKRTMKLSLRKRGGGHPELSRVPSVAESKKNLHAWHTRLDLSAYCSSYLMDAVSKSVLKFSHCIGG